MPKKCCKNHKIQSDTENEKSCHSKEKHENHSHQGCVSKDSAGDFLGRFWIVTVLMIPLVLGTKLVSGWTGWEIFANHYLKFVFATAIFYYAFIFFRHAKMELARKKPGMMTLVSLAVGAGYLFSAVSTFVPSLPEEFYLEISSLIWVLLFGHYLEAKSSGAAGDALGEVAKLLPKKAHLLKDGEEQDVEISELKDGDIVIVKPGEKVPADGKIVKGSANVDESLISGESKPVEKSVGSEVVAGSIVLDSSLEISLTRVGEHSTVGQIHALISEAQKTKPRSQRIADVVSGYLTLIALSVALISFAVWMFVVGETFVFAITVAITVLVITCPHALGLAIPTVTSIGTTLAVKNGFFIKDLSKIETIRKTDWVIFDKTGTLTEGVFGVQDIISYSQMSENEILKLTASLEQNSSHIIGLSILKEAKEKNLELPEIEEFKNIAGKGISGEIDGIEYFAGNKSLLEQIGLKDKIPEDEKLHGKTLVYLATKNEIMGVITLADKVKEEAKVAIERLHSLGIKTAMLTGDNKTVAESVAKELGIDKYFAEVLPDKKYKHIKELQSKGDVVLMVGDGVNDAPALTQADAGVAIGAGTDVAVESGDVVLMRNNPADIVKLVILSREIYRKMKQNLWWAFGYNIFFIPAAAGVFYSWGFMLHPELGAAFMTASDIIVVANAMLLKKVKL